MYLAEAIPPVGGPLWIPALQSLMILAALFVLLGIIKAVDAITRAFFAKVEGTIGWIPYADKVLGKPIHSIEKKITHTLGRAEQKIDEAIALSWHNMARVVHFIGKEIAGAAETAWHLAQQAKAFVRHREVTHEIKAAVTPVKARAAGAERTGELARKEAKAVHNTVAHGVYPRIKAAEHERAHVLNPGIESAREAARTAEDAAIASYKYLTKHRRSVIAGVFTGAVAWALTRVGGGWIRCNNWRKIGKHVCRMPWKWIDELLTLSLALLVRVDPVVIAEAAVRIEDVFDPIIKGTAEPDATATAATKAAVRFLEAPLEFIGGVFPG